MPSTKLSLHIETLRRLSSGDAQSILGGMAPETNRRQGCQTLDCSDLVCTAAECGTATC